MQEKQTDIIQKKEFITIVKNKVQSLNKSIDKYWGEYWCFKNFIDHSQRTIESHSCPNLENFFKSRDNIKKLMEELENSCSVKVFASNLEAIKKELSQQKEYFFKSPNEIWHHCETEILDTKQALNMLKKQDSDM